MRVRLLVVVMLSVLNLGVLGIVGLTWVTKKHIDLNLLGFALLLNLFGAAIFWAAKNDE